MVSLTLVFLSIVILVVVFCCLKQRRPWKSSTEFINRSFVSSISGKKNKEHNEMSPVTISRMGTCNKFKSKPKMAAMEWTESAVSYETLENAKGSSTPSQNRRMPTIEERDSAYTDQEASIDSETSINSRTFL